MRIFVCPVRQEFRPDHQDFVWPPRNREPGQDFGVEQDFDRWLYGHDGLLVRDAAAADWGYVPIFWNRYYINNKWGDEGRSDLAAQLENCKRAHGGLRLFTVCEYDLAVLSPYLDLSDVVVFCASRRAEGTGIDIPLLSAPHPACPGDCEKKWLAYFAGHLQTDGIRIRMNEVLKAQGRPDVYCEYEQSWCDVFRDYLCASYLALSPRGQGVQSFRFYEAMQLGTAPLYLSNIDARPFKRWLNWEECSFWARTPEELPPLLDELALDLGLLLEMGRRAKAMFDRSLGYGRWCSYILRELEQL